MKYSLLFFTIFCVLCVQFSLQEESYDIEYKICSNQNQNNDESGWLQSGKLLIRNLGLQRKEPIIKLNFDQLISLNNITPEEYASSYVLIKFILEDNQSKVFSSYFPLNQLKNIKYNEYVEIAVNYLNDIISINYGIDKYLTRHDSYQIGIQQDPPLAVIVETIESTQMHFVSEEEFSKKQVIGPDGQTVEQPQQPQGFFQRYYWYIIVGVVIFFIMSKFADQQQGEGGQAGGSN